MNRKRVSALALAVALTAGTAAAHHGWGDYDAGKVFTIAGPVEAVTPGNPHVTITLKSGGKTWLAVLAPPSRMSTRGLPAETITKGLAVSVEGYPKRNGEPEMRAERITVAGKVVELR